MEEEGLSPAQLRLLKRKQKILTAQDNRLSKISGVIQKKDDEPVDESSPTKTKTPEIVFASDRVDERVQDLMALKAKKLLEEERELLEGKKATESVEEKAPETEDREYIQPKDGSLPDLSSLLVESRGPVLKRPQLTLRTLCIILLCCMILWQYPATHLWLDADHVQELFPLDLGPLLGRSVPSWTVFLTLQALFSVREFVDVLSLTRWIFF